MSSFNPDTFLSQETRDTLQSKYTPIPSAEYRAMIADVKAGVAKTENGESPTLSVTFKVLEADALKAQLGYRDDQDLTVTKDYWLDLNASGGFDIGPNKNVQLGKLREALGQNVGGQPWSPLMMRGAGPIMIQVGIEASKKNPDVEYNTVKRVARAF